jgi:hypothetical protein
LLKSGYDFYAKLIRMERSELRDRMLALVKQWEDSGDSQHDFAEKHQISPSKFKYWIRKANGKSPVEPSFIPLTNPISASHYFLRFPNGVELHVPANTPIHALRQFIGG